MLLDLLFIDPSIDQVINSYSNPPPNFDSLINLRIAAKTRIRVVHSPKPGTRAVQKTSNSRLRISLNMAAIVSNCDFIEL